MIENNTGLQAISAPYRDGGYGGAGVEGLWCRTSPMGLTTMRGSSSWETHNKVNNCWGVAHPYEGHYQRLCRVDGVYSVCENEILQALILVHERIKVVVERSVSGSVI